MRTIFSLILSNCLPAAMLLLAVFAARILLRRAPRRFMTLLWILAAFRLAIPFSPESSLSLQPSPQNISMTFSQRTESTVSVSAPVKLTGDLRSKPKETIPSPTRELKETRGLNRIDFGSLAFAFWVLGMSGMLVYAVIGSLRIRQITKNSTLCEERVMLGTGIQTPFVFGLFRPLVYLPSGLSEKEKMYVLAHEKTHLKRGDQYKKPLGFLLLTVYWFHPLVWIAWILFCRDLEAACDEAVIGTLDRNGRADYAEALLHCSTGTRIPAPCPVAFGEISVRSRIQKVLFYKKPSAKLALCTVVICALLAVGFMTVPAASEDTFRLKKVTETAEKVEIEYAYRLGDQVKSYVVSAEYWEDGTMTRLVTFRPENTSGTLYLGMRQTNSEDKRSFDILGGFQKKTATVGMLIPFSEDVLGWTCFVQPESMTLSAVPGKGLVLSVISFDTGNGISQLDCTALTKDDTSLRDAKGTFVVFRVYPSAEENPDMSRFWTRPVLTIEDVEAFAAQGKLTWKDLEAYSLEDVVNEDAWTRRTYSVEEPFHLVVSGNPEESSPTEAMLCVSDKECSLFADGLSDFITEHRQKLIPTKASLEGFYDQYLFLPTESGTIRYTWVDTENRYTKDLLLGEFAEDESADGQMCKVYSVKEDPQRRILCAVFANGAENVLKYCPASASSKEVLEKLKQEGTLVLEDGEVTYGLDAAEDFAHRTELGQESKLTVISWYGALDPKTCSEEYYDANQEDYPRLFTTGIFFVGDVYHVEFEEGISRQYLYLRKLTDNNGREHMVLTDDETATYEKMVNSLFSSHMNDEIRFFEIY